VKIVAQDLGILLTTLISLLTYVPPFQLTLE